jgi:hypothetical protein
VKRKRKERRAKRGGRTRVGWFGGCWAGPVPGSAQWLPFPFFICSGSFSFLFSISFTTFAYLVQFASNQLCKVSKIQSNIPEQ